MRLLRSDKLLEHALAVLSRERKRLDSVTNGELVLTGGCSVPGALTTGDVDLHLRVAANDFAAVVGRLRDVYTVVLPEIWTGTLATFGVPGEAVGIAVTPIGSEHDLRFTRSWERLRSEPALLKQYNAMKREHAGGDASAYLAAKARFFDALDASAG